jgi:hypothetical protein
MSTGFRAHVRWWLLAGAVLLLAAFQGAPAVGRATPGAPPVPDWGSRVLFRFNNASELCGASQTPAPLPDTSFEGKVEATWDAQNNRFVISMPEVTNAYFGYTVPASSGSFLPGIPAVLKSTDGRVKWNVIGVAGGTVFTPPVGLPFVTFQYPDLSGQNCTVVSGGLGILDTPLPALPASPPANAPTWYVQPSGSDGNSCTQSAPCRSIDGAFKRFVQEVNASPDLSYFINVKSDALKAIAWDQPAITVPPGASLTIRGDSQLPVEVSAESVIQVGGGGTLVFENLALNAPIVSSVADFTLVRLRVISITKAYLPAGRESLKIASGSTTIRSSAFSGLLMPGGADIYVDPYADIYVAPGASLEMISSTMTANSGGPLIDAAPGATVTIEASTLSGNSTLGHPSLDSEGRFQPQIAGAFDASSPYTVTNSILGPNDANNCGVTVRSGGHNIDSGHSCGLSGPGDLSDTDPRVAGLDFYGGGIETLALFTTSPARDAGGSNCPLTDERGSPRPQGAACDIGSFEITSATADLVASVTTDRQSVTVGSPVTLTVTVRNDGGTAHGAGVRLDLFGLAPDRAEPSVGEFGIIDGVAYWLIGTLSQGQQATMTLHVKQSAYGLSVVLAAARGFERNASVGKSAASVTINSGARSVVVPAVASDQ